MSLTVLSVAFSRAPVGPQAVGGAEQILTELDRALTAAGHTSLVLACEGSQVAGRLFSVPLNDSFAPFQSALDRILAERRVDLIHMHGLDFPQYKLPADVPVLVTLHLPVAWYPQTIWTLPANIHLQCVSNSQRSTCPAEFRDLPVVSNGVAPNAVRVEKSNFALVLGRICPEKNQHAAHEAGSLAGVPVLLGGCIFPYPEHERYFREKIEPLLQYPHEPPHQFLGPLPPERKNLLLAQAKCLLHPTLAPETSSLVAMEALAAGTPVIAYRAGAMPEIVDDGVTGFLVNGVEEMTAAIHRIDNIHPDTCREVAAQRFSLDRMVCDYFRLYQSLLQTGIGDSPVAGPTSLEPLHA